ncbi:hypothetical protein Tco_0019580 [Tanacetum coccineum]
MTNQQIRDSPTYKTYLAFATGATTPKKAWKFKKSASPSKKKALVAVFEPAKKLVKKSAARRQSAAASLKEAQLKKAIKRSKRETNIHQAGGSSEGADLVSEVPDEPKGKSIDISEGIGLKPRVPDVSKADSTESEYKSFGDSDDDDDDQQSGDERTESDDEKSVDLNKTDYEEKDEFVHTPDDYVPTDDENVDDEEYERINKEMYDDVNVELKDAEHANEEKGDEEMTHAENVNVEHEEVSQEVVDDQVKDDTQAIVTAAPATQKTEVPLQRSSISSDYATKFLNFVNIPSGEIEIISMMDIKAHHEYPKATISTTYAPDSSTLTAFHKRLFDLENEVKTLRNVDHSSAIRAVIKSEVPTIVKEYLGTNLDDTLHKIKMEHVAKQQESQYTIKSFGKDALKEFDHKRALFETMTASKTFNNHPKHKALYHALMESIIADKDSMDKDQGLKRMKTGKDTKQSKKAKSIGTSKGTTKSQPKSTGKSAKAEEIVFEAGDT